MQPFTSPPAQLTVKPGLRPALRELVVEASRALAQLDADRLEELVLSCQALTRDLALTRESSRESTCESARDIRPINGTERQRLVREARDAQRDMALFARVLDATRANVQVIERLRALRAGRLEYGECGGPRWISAVTGHRETRHGND